MYLRLRDCSRRGWEGKGEFGRAREKGSPPPSSLARGLAPQFPSPSLSTPATQANETEIKARYICSIRV